MSVLLCGCETWKLTKGEEEKLDIFQTKCLRRIFKIRWQEHVTNKRVLEMAETGRISEEVRRLRWNWIGHVLRKDKTDDCAVALGWTSEGRRKRGRPKPHGDEWWNWKETVQAGTRGTQYAVQLQTDAFGRMISKPCVPPGTQRE
jgi:hypothetical protein